MRRNWNTVLTLINAANDTLIYSNSSIDLNEYNNRTNEQQFSEDEELNNWPPWVQKVTNVSHLLLALNSSVNFYIYFMKRQALNSGNPAFYLEPTWLLHQGILWDTNMYIYLFHFNLADQNMPALDRRETIRLSIIQPWEKTKNMISLCGHQWSRNYFYDIFCLSWHLISLFDARCCIFPLMLVIGE